MLTQVILMTSPPKTFNIDSVDPNEVVILKSISGLTPNDLDLFTGDYARDGGYYRGRRVGRRNPVFHFKLNPDYANNIEVSDARELLYSWFLGSEDATNGLRVVLKDDRRPDREFIAFTEKLESEIFAKETTAMVSTLCLEPYLTSTLEVLNGYGSGVTSTNLTYAGSAPAGFACQIQAQATLSTVNLNVNNRIMTYSGPLNNGDLLLINTTPGSRYVRKNGVDAMAGLVGPTVWPTLKQGNNAVSVYGNGSVKLLSLTYKANWWGV